MKKFFNKFGRWSLEFIVEPSTWALINTVLISSMILLSSSFFNVSELVLTQSLVIIALFFAFKADIQSQGEDGKCKIKVFIRKDKEEPRVSDDDNYLPSEDKEDK